MPATTFPDHLQRLESELKKAVASGEAGPLDLRVDQRSSLRGYIAGSLQFKDASELHFREFVDTNLPEPRMMYAYHYQTAEKALVFRYDNAQHRPPVSQSAHKHTPDGVNPSSAPTLADILDEIFRFLAS